MFTHWGSTSCPSGTVKLYEGFVANTHFWIAGSGANYLCMHPEPQKPEGNHGGNQNGALLYGVEYETGTGHKDQNKDAGCAVCEHETSSTVYVQWGRKSCTGGHETVYWGAVMANHHTFHRTEYICVDWARESHATSDDGNQDGGLLYTTRMQTSGSSSDES